MITRLLLAATAPALVAATFVQVPDASAAPAPPAAPVAPAHKVRLTLPAPTGASKVGTTELHLVDRARRDPWTGKRHRELMVSVWYPARSTQGHPLAPQMHRRAAAHFDRQGIAPPGKVDWAATRTHSHVGAPVDRRGGRRPVLLFSPGHLTPRSLNTLLVEDLASRGYVVVSIDHTYDPVEVEFPGGRVEPNRQPKPTPQNIHDILSKELRTRSADARFVLDAIARLNKGGNPDAEHRRLPRGVRGSLDLARVGMFGHSLGGAASAQTMHDDRRVDAGINLDGGMVTEKGPLGSVVKDGLRRPFMILNSLMGDHTTGAIQPFWANLRGWHRNFQLKGSWHNSYTDLQVMEPQLAKAGVVTEAQAAEDVGTADPAQAARNVAVERAYIRAFFDLHLRQRGGRLLDGPSARFPEMRFVP